MAAGSSPRSLQSAHTVTDFYEIDFLPVASNRSGDAITLRYRIDGRASIHVVDGGFQSTGESVVQHINRYYDNPYFIDHVVATHPDGDHAGGLRTVIESFEIGTLWLYRPWLYAEALLPYFPRFRSLDGLARRLREIYPNISALEEIALERGIFMREPRQGAMIGAFNVTSPDIGNYLYQVIESEKTPESNGLAQARARSDLFAGLAGVVNAVRTAWGVEVFSPEETSAENEMSVVQYARLCGDPILLTGDAGRLSLGHTFQYLTVNEVEVPRLTVFQIPHHGSRRNLSSEILDGLLGPRRAQPGMELTGLAVVSALIGDPDHPRKAVIRGCIHRGFKVLTTGANTVCVHNGGPARGWAIAPGAEYPPDQENA